MRFTIFTHVEHRKQGKNFLAYSPYVREMNLWLNHVDKLEVVAPISEVNSNGIAEYEHSDLHFCEIPSFNLLSPKVVLQSCFKIPFIGLKLIKSMRRSDHIHLRCPGNIGLIACICQIFFPKKSKSAKYAGNWDPDAKQPWTYKLQKWILSNSFLTRNMKVLVYGDWPRQSKNIKPFFTASFSENDIEHVREKSFQNPFFFLFVGNLVEGKQPLEAIKLVEKLNFREGSGRLEIFGDGPERDKLEEYCRINGLQELVVFKGVQPLEALKKAYQKAHFVVLPSRSEGWPKAIAEGMFYGCIPIATPVSCVPWMLGNGSRGILLEGELLDTFQKSSQFECFSDSPQGESKNISRTGFSETLEVTERLDDEVQKIVELLGDTQRMNKMSEEAKKWSQQYTLEKFEAAIQEVLNKRFNV